MKVYNLEKSINLEYVEYEVKLLPVEMRPNGLMIEAAKKYHATIVEILETWGIEYRVYSI